MVRTGEPIIVVGQVANLPGQDSILPHEATFIRDSTRGGAFRLRPCDGEREPDSLLAVRLTAAIEQWHTGKFPALNLDL
jgi:hypothetical protein